MRYTNFAGGFMGKLVGGLFCIILGMVLTLGGIALGGYILVTRKGMVGTLEDLAQGRNLPVDFDDAYREMALLDWGKQLLPVLSNFTSTPIGELELALGLNVLSDKISDITGLELQVVKDSTLGDFGKTFAENLTLEQASTNFGIEFPDLPAFQDEEFLSKPLATAFAAIDEFELQDFIEVTPESSPILLSLADMKIGEMSDPTEGLDARINNLMLKEVITIVEEEGANQSNKILIKLKDTKIGELGSSATNDLIMEMKLSEVIEIDQATATPALWELRDTAIGDLGSAETDEKIKNMKIADLLEVDENSTQILKYFRDNGTTLAGHDEDTLEPNGVDAALKIMKLGDMMTLTDPSQPGGSTKLFWALRDCPLETIPATETEPEILGIEDTLRVLPLNEFLDAGASDVWTYLGEATIENLGQKIDDMCMKHVIDITEDSPAILRKMRAFDPEKDTAGNQALFGTEDMKINELNTKLEPLVQGMKLGEIITVDENSEPILQALKDTTISGMNAKIALLKVNEVFSEAEYSSGVLSLVDPETQITGIAMALSSAVSTARIQVLINCGIINETTISDDEMEVGFRNNSVNGIISDYASLLNNPVGGTAITPERIYLNPAQNTIDMAFLDGLAGFDEGDTLVLGADTTVAAEGFTKIFNVMTNGFVLTITSGATIRSASYDGTKYTDYGGYMLLTNDYYDSELPLMLPIVSGGGSVSGAFADPAGIKDNYKITITSI